MNYILRFLKFCGILSVIALVMLFFQFNTYAMVFADSWRTGTGWMVFTALCLVELAAFVMLALAWYPGRSKLILHANPTQTQLDAFATEMRRRLHASEIVRQAGIRPDQEDFVPRALDVLNARAEEIIRQDSRKIFLGTALAQNGRLDAIIVFVALARMVWRISRVYNQRPTPAEMWSVYSTVSASAFVAFSIDALDIPRTVTEAMGALVPAMGPHVAGTSVPFMGNVMHVFTTSMLDGAANGLLAVRAGVITRNAFRYAALDERAPRSVTTSEVNAAMLALSRDCVADIVVGFRDQVKNMACSMADSCVEKTVGAAQSVASAVTGTVSAAGGVVVSGVGAAGDAAVSAGKAVAGGVEATGRAVGDAAVSAARSVASGVEAVGDAAVSAGKAVAGGVEATGRAVGDAAVSAARSVASGVETVGDAAVSAGKAVAAAPLKVAGKITRGAGSLFGRFLPGRGGRDREQA